jgi:hypothetical protein
MPNVLQMADLLEEIGYKNSVAIFRKKRNNTDVIKHIHKLYWDVQARGEFDWYFSCKDKIKYPTAWEATKAAYRQSDWRRKDYDPYKCRFCDKYHVGRTVEEREIRKKYYEEQIQAALSQR